MTEIATLTDAELARIDDRRDPTRSEVAVLVAMARRMKEAEAKALSRKLFGHVKYAPYCDGAIQYFCQSDDGGVRGLAIELVQTREERGAAEATIGQLREQVATLREALLNIWGRGEDLVFNQPGQAWREVLDNAKVALAMTDHSPPNCFDMTTENLLAEDAALAKRLSDLHASLEESGGSSGSPGEWIYERRDEIAEELRRRAALAATAPEPREDGQ